MLVVLRLHVARQREGQRDAAVHVIEEVEARAETGRSQRVGFACRSRGVGVPDAADIIKAEQLVAVVINRGQVPGVRPLQFKTARNAVIADDLGRVIPAT